MRNLKLSLLADRSEFIICLIRENCKNQDDLSKIALAVECMLEEVSEERRTEAPTIKQVLLQNI
jgi:hypothetical protein